jgi:O-antigen ligase
MDSIIIRLELYQQAINAFLSAPFFGIGWGELSYYMYLNKESIGIDRNAHNVFIHFLAETGIIGLALLVSALYCTRPANYNSTYTPLYSIIGIQLIHSMVEFPYAYMNYLIVLGLAIGMINAKEQ